MAYWISVIMFAMLCILMVGLFYILIKKQEKKFKRYLNDKLREAINIINKSTINEIGIALNVIDSTWRDKNGKS